MTSNTAFNTRHTRAAAPAAAGTTVVTSNWVDTRGFTDVSFTAIIGAIVSGGTVDLKLQYSNDGTNSAGDVAGSAMTGLNTQNQAYVLGLRTPQSRWVRLHITRNTQNSTVDSILAALCGAAVAPTSEMAANHKQVNAAPVGTA